jgi:hypothetical protein
MNIMYWVIVLYTCNMSMVVSECMLVVISVPDSGSFISTLTN